MNITLYSGFTKRTNSTKQPTSGTDVTVTLKEPTSIENPSFELSGGVSSYEGVTAVKWGSRYYFVTDITSDSYGVTTISCTLDRGATFKTDIGGTTAFIERAATGYNGNIMDPSVSATNNSYIQVAKSGDMFPNAPSDAGYVVLQAISTDTSDIAGGGVAAYFFDAAQSGFGGYRLYSLLADLWTSNVYDNIKNVLADTWSALIRATYVPCFYSNALSPATSFEAAKVTLGKDLSTIDTYRYKNSQGRTCAYTFEQEFNLNNIKKYATFRWQNLSPFATWKMYLPFYGVVDVPVDEYLMDTTGALLVIRATLDYITGDLTYVRYKRYYIAGVATDYPMAKYDTCIGIDIPLSNIKSGNWAAGATALVSSAVNAAVGNYTSALSSMVSGIQAAFQNSVSSVGSAGKGVSSLTSEFGSNKPAIYLYQIGYEPNVDPADNAASIGLPVMAQDLISNHSGFIKCNNASVSMTGTQADKDAVNAMLNSGFFYE